MVNNKTMNKPSSAASSTGLSSSSSSTSLSPSVPSNLPKNLPFFPQHSKLVVFILTFWSYVMMKAANKSFSLVQPILIKQQFFTSTVYSTSSSGQTQMIGLISTLFLIIYAIGQFFVGTLADKIDLRYFLTFAMIFAGILTILFSLTGYLQFREVWIYCIIWSFNGIAQACGWPSNLTIMNNWFGKKSRGLIFSAWSSNANLGNILGAIICGIIFATYSKEKTVWQLCMLICGLGAIIGALPIYLFLIPKPFLNDEEFSDSHISNTTNTNQNQQNQPTNRSLRPNTLQKYTSIVFTYNKSTKQFDSNPSDDLQQSQQPDNQLVVVPEHSSIEEQHLGDDLEGQCRQQAEHQHEVEVEAEGHEQEGIELQLSSSGHNRQYTPLKQSSSENLPSTSSGSHQHQHQHQQLSQQPSYFTTLVMGLKTRGVIPYMIIYACIKGVVYVFMYWVPFFLTSSKHMSNSNAAIISALFDIGGFVGGVCSGHLTDLIGSRTLVIILMITVSLGLVWILFHSIIDEVFSVSICLLMLGIGIGGVQVLISGSVALDLGDIASKKKNDTTETVETNEPSGNNQSEQTQQTQSTSQQSPSQQQAQSQAENVTTSLTGTISGLVEGSGSGGAALLQYLVGELLTCQQQSKSESSSSGDDDENDNVVCEWNLILIVITVAIVLALVCLLYVKFLNKLL